MQKDVANLPRVSNFGPFSINSPLKTKIFNEIPSLAVGIRMRCNGNPKMHPELLNGAGELDEQERLIVRHLIRDPRESDNGIGEATGVNVRTVGRKRQRLEQAGVLSYFTHVDLSSTGTGQFNTRHLYIIKFRIGITYKQLLDDIKREPFVRSIFTEIIFESHIAEIDGKLAMLLFIDGASDTESSRRSGAPDSQPAAQPRRRLDRGSLNDPHPRARANDAELRAPGEHGNGLHP